MRPPATSSTRGAELHLAAVGEPDGNDAPPEARTDHGRRAWHEGPDEEAPTESWLGLGDDELLHRIETLEPGANVDAQLMEVVRSDRHFFIRQEAAKRVRDRGHRPSRPPPPARCPPRDRRGRSWVPGAPAPRTAP